MSEIDQLMKLLGGEHGAVAQVLGWIAAMRVAMKPVAHHVLGKLTSMLVSVCESPEIDDDEIVKTILSKRWYRITAFMLDLICSLKLPTLATFSHLKTTTNKPHEN